MSGPWGARNPAGAVALLASLMAALVLTAPATSALSAVPPGTPTAVSAVADDGAAAISWAPPRSDGGAPIDKYRVVAQSAAGRATVVAPCGACRFVYFSGLVNGVMYTIAVAAHNTAGYSLVPALVRNVTPQPSTPAVPAAPARVDAVGSGLSAAIQWQPPASAGGAAVDRYLVEADDLSLTTPGTGAEYYSGWVYACGTCASATFAGLSKGDAYQFVVYAHNRFGYGPGTASGSVSGVDSTCPASRVCVTVDGATVDGRTTGNAAGFLHHNGFVSTTGNGLTTFTYTGVSPSLITALGPSSWRSSACTYAGGPGDPSNPACQWLQHNVTTNLTDVLSDDYQSRTYSSDTQGSRPPWECWSCYADDVTAIVGNTATNNVVPAYLGTGLPATAAYWDIQNEPGSTLGPHQSGTTSLYLQQFKAAYAAIKSVGASIPTVGPSLADFTDTPMPYDPHVLGLDSLLPYAVANNLRFDAVSWHNNSPVLDDTPTVFPYVVAQLRYLESEYNVSWAPRAFANEYAPQFSHLIPGWSAGWIAAIEASGVDQANRACWEEPGTTSPTALYSECGANTYAGSLDGLFTPPDGSPAALQPNANYWVYRFYAGMAGNRVRTTTSNQTLTAMASRDDLSSTLRLLVGRHESCTPLVNQYDCNTGKAPEVARLPTPPPADVSITIAYPYAATAVTASVATIRDLPGPAAEPVPTTQRLVVVGGTVTIDLPTFADGDAYTITLTPSA